MKIKLILIIIIALCFSLLHFSCTIPRLIWSQKDIQSFTINQLSLPNKILIASHRSKFKQGIIDNIKNSLQNEPVYIKFIGIKNLNQQDINQYKAVLIMTSCIAWGINSNITSFLKNNKNNKNIIILTTSADGEWTPHIEGHQYD
ncbi:MAG: hypothetical protein P8078_01795, partial [bacterium]